MSSANPVFPSSGNRLLIVLLHLEEAMLPMNSLMTIRIGCATVLCSSWFTLSVAAESESAFIHSPPKTYTETVTAGSAEYTVEVGGQLDMDNTMTRVCSNRHIAFQNNVSLTITNTGHVPVTNPRVITNGLRRWHDIDSLLDEFTQGAETKQDQIYLIWERMRLNRHHDDPLYGDNEFHDPVRWLNVYGGGLCDDAGKCGSALYQYLGFNEANGGEDAFVRCLHGHMQCEVFHDGAFQFMDIDENVFFLDRENRKPVSGDALARDHDLANRELPYGPIMTDFRTARMNASLFGIDDDRTYPGMKGYTMDYTLRPGERLVFRWDNVGKHSWKHTEGPHRYYGNSKIVYEPLSSSAPMPAGALDGFSRDGETLVCRKRDAVLTLKTTSCYTFCGGTVVAALGNGSKDTRFTVESSVDGTEYVTVSEHQGSEASSQVSLDDALGVHGGPPRRTHYVRFSLRNGKGATLSGIRIETDITASPMALPRLGVGTNRVEYADDTSEPHEMTVTHEWLECSSVVPPRSPQEPESPEDGAVVADTYVGFRWPAVEGCDAYRIRVSRRSDFLYPYRPNHDLVVPTNEHAIPKRGMFSVDETYYWRVRPRLASGVWGQWGPTWTFQWKGPMVPKDLSHRIKNGAIVVSWKPNPRGTRPVRYDVYGSDERGFSVNREPHEVPVLGRVPGNFVASTTRTEFVVVSSDADLAGMNKSYYRVVAVDNAGIESCPSDYAEMPRPHVYTRPVVQATAGQPYAYQLDTIRTIGDLQHRYVEPTKGYWEKEAYRFSLKNGPAWVALDEATGLLTGAPSATDAGETTVEILVTATYPDEVDAESKSGKSFQKRRMRAELRRECTHRFVLETDAN